MSLRLMSAVWRYGPTKQAERMVLLALADYADDAGHCWPGISSLMSRTCMTDRGVQRILHRLEADGWLSIERRGGRRLTNLYMVNTPTQCPGIDDEETPTLDPETPTLDPETPTLSTQNPDPGSPEPSRTIIEPSEPSLERAREPTNEVDEMDGQRNNNAQPIGAAPEASAENGKGHSLSAAKQRTQFSADWWPSPAGQQFALDHGCPDIAANVAACLDHHIAKGSVFADHNRAWQTWCRNASSFGWAGAANVRRAGNNHRSAPQSERGAYVDRLLASTLAVGDEWAETEPGKPYDA